MAVSIFVIFHRVIGHLKQFPGVLCTRELPLLGTYATESLDSEESFALESHACEKLKCFPVSYAPKSHDSAKSYAQESCDSLVSYVQESQLATPDPKCRRIFVE